MLRQHNPFAGKDARPPRALPIQFVLAEKVSGVRRRVRRRIRAFWWRHDSIGWALVGSVIAAGMWWFLMGQL